MWLDPAGMSRWMRPGDADVIYVEMHPVVGGTFRIDTQTQDGRVFIHTGQYLEIERPSKLVFSWNSTVLQEHSSRVTIEFHPEGENCRMILEHELPPDDVLYQDHHNGWTTILDLFTQDQDMHSK